MALMSLTIDVYCDRGEGDPSYRVYVDDELLTERSWTWPGYEVLVREHVAVDVEPGAHRLWITECNCDPVFHAKNMTVNGVPFPHSSGVFFA